MTERLNCHYYIEKYHDSKLQLQEQACLKMKFDNLKAHSLSQNVQCLQTIISLLSLSHYLPQHSVHPHETKVKLRIFSFYPFVMRWGTEHKI